MKPVMKCKQVCTDDATITFGKGKGINIWSLIMSKGKGKGAGGDDGDDWGHGGKTCKEVCNEEQKEKCYNDCQ